MTAGSAYGVIATRRRQAASASVAPATPMSLAGSMPPRSTQPASGDSSMRATSSPGDGSGRPPGRRCGRAPASAVPAALPPSGRNPSVAPVFAASVAAAARMSAKCVCRMAMPPSTIALRPDASESTRAFCVSSSELPPASAESSAASPAGSTTACRRTGKWHGWSRVEIRLTLQPASAALRTRCASIGASSRTWQPTSRSEPSVSTSRRGIPRPG